MQEGDFFSSLFMVWLLPMLLLGGFWMLVFRRMKPGAGMMSIGRSRAKVVAEEGTGVTFADVAGVDEAKDELREIVDFLSSPEKFRKLGAQHSQGRAVRGPARNRQNVARARGRRRGHVPFFSLTGSDFVEMFVGVGAARVRDLFQQAQQKAPCIVFIDELDAVGKARGAGNLAGHDEREQTLNQLLSEMDGFDARKGLIIMAATNRPETLDSALMRPGRFDRQVLVDRPDKAGREAILKVHAKGVQFRSDVDLVRVAALTPGMAGADLANLINEAALLAPRRNKAAVGPAELNEAIERTIAGLEKKNRLHEHAREGDRGASRERPRAARRDPADDGSRAQSVDDPARHGRARLHDAAAARGSLSHDAAGAARQDHRAHGRARRRARGVQRGLDGRDRRPAARDRSGAAHGRAVRHVVGAGAAVGGEPERRQRRALHARCRGSAASAATPSARSSSSIRKCRSCCGGRSSARWRCSSTTAPSCWRWRRGCARRR